jgi:hypothetical protein
MKAPPQSFAPFEEFRQCVLNNPELFNRLRSVPPEQFVTACVHEAAELGYSVAPAEVEAALKTARCDWVERWCQ